jgi:hypothetical protein
MIMMGKYRKVWRRGFAGKFKFSCTLDFSQMWGTDFPSPESAAMMS